MIRRNFFRSALAAACGLAAAPFVGIGKAFGHIPYGSLRFADGTCYMWNGEKWCPPAQPFFRNYTAKYEPVSDEEFIAKMLAAMKHTKFTPPLEKP